MEKDLFGRCPYATAQRLIQGIILMHELSGEPVRFNELQRRMPKMTHATLSNQHFLANSPFLREKYGEMDMKLCLFQIDDATVERRTWELRKIQLGAFRETWIVP